VKQLALALAVTAVLAFALLGHAAPPRPIATPAKDIVYITKSGTKFHRSTCRTIKKSKKIEISRQDAVKKGYAACKVCKP
jgi:hypothetical protein